MDGNIDFNGHEFEQTPETGMLQSTGSKRTQHSNWTTTNCFLDFGCKCMCRFWKIPHEKVHSRGWQEIKGRSGKGWKVGKKTNPLFITGEGNVTHCGLHTHLSSEKLQWGGWGNRGSHRKCNLPCVAQLIVIRGKIWTQTRPFRLQTASTLLHTLLWKRGRDHSCNFSQS